MCITVLEDFKKANKKAERVVKGFETSDVERRTCRPRSDPLPDMRTSKAPDSNLGLLMC